MLSAHIYILSRPMIYGSCPIIVDLYTQERASILISARELQSPTITSTMNSPTFPCSDKHFSLTCPHLLSLVSDALSKEATTPSKLTAGWKE